MALVDPIFGPHADALAVHARRMEVLAANIANADTPGYKARDVDFAKVLSSTQRTGAATTSASRAPIINDDPRHIPIDLSMSGKTAGAGLTYRTSTQPSADGNTVDVQQEQAQFADAALHYQASLSFANARIKDLMSAMGTT